MIARQYVCNICQEHIASTVDNPGCYALGIIKPPNAPRTIAYAARGSEGRFEVHLCFQCHDALRRTLGDFQAPFASEL